jgi:hypothetical protein
VSIITSGSWLASKFNSLSATQKIRVRYLQLLSAIRGNKSYQYIWNQIEKFNNFVDGVLGRNRDTGGVSVTVLKDGRRIGSGALVTIGAEKAGSTDSTGHVGISGISVGRGKSINVRDIKTSKDYELENPGQTVNIIYHYTNPVIVRLK